MIVEKNKTKQSKRCFDKEVVDKESSSKSFSKFFYPQNEVLNYQKDFNFIPKIFLNSKSFKNNSHKFQKIKIVRVLFKIYIFELLKLKKI